MSEPKFIRNFSIIAHIDHGKSTLADRFIQICGGLSEREMKMQVLDSMDIERERGITIKAQSVTLDYQHPSGQVYQFNFIDTPGHVDFSYEVSRSLAACEGALLVVDAAQGVEAQSVANTYTAIDQGLEVIPVLNKVDLPQADPEAVATEIEQIIGLSASDAIKISAKTGEGIDLLLQQLVEKIPAPTGDPEQELQALIIDSWFDNYLGIVSLIRIKQGRIKLKDKIQIKSTGKSYQVDQLGIFTPKPKQKNMLSAGEAGFVIAGIKNLEAAPVGDTITHAATPNVAALPGFKQVRPQVFAAIFPTSNDAYDDFKDALLKLKLNDSSLQFEPESSSALGFGFRIGFLGMLHMEIIQERLEREYNLDLITTAPTVVYQIKLKDQTEIYIDNPEKLPDLQKIASINEPLVEANMLLPQNYLGNVISLCVEKRGQQKNMQFIGRQVNLTYLLPMNEVVLDFFDQLQSISQGYASLDYQFTGFQPAPMVKLDVLINGDRVDALSIMVHKDFAQSRGRLLTEKMKDIIPRQMFDVAIQAALGSHIIARQTVKAMRKNVTAKCYGGDITRKKKLLQKQKAGKKRMKQIGRVEIPQDAFLAVLKVNKHS